MKLGASSYRCAAVYRTLKELKVCKSSAKRMPSIFTQKITMMTKDKGQYPGLTRSPIILIRRIKGQIVEAIMRGGPN